MSVQDKILEINKNIDNFKYDFDKFFIEFKQLIDDVSADSYENGKIDGYEEGYRDCEDEVY